MIWLKPNAQEGGWQRFETVNVTTLDTFAQRKNGLTVDFLKVDAEGKDRDVLAGAMELLQNSVSVFTFECAPCALKESELDTFDRMGFSCFSLTKAGNLMLIFCLHLLIV